MTLEQIKTEIRNAYDSRDRERMEWALRCIASTSDCARELRPPAVQKPNPCQVKEPK